MSAEPEPLQPAALRALVPAGRFGTQIHCFRELASTQQAALEAAAAGAAEGTVFLAESQTQGRGRHGHAWLSPPGAGIYASLVLRPQRPASALLRLTLAVGLAVADAVRETSGVRPEIRWPNDLLLAGRKFCGLLIEMAGDAGGHQHAALGIGINVRPHAFPPELAELATALDLHAAAPVSRLALCAAVLRQVEERYAAWSGGGDAAILREFEGRSAYARGMEVRVGGDGTDAYRGRTDGLHPDGFLRVRLPDGSVRYVLSGDVRPAS